MDEKLYSMKRSEKDKRTDMGETAPITSIAADYPYGLCIHLDKDELDKIGIKELPEVGGSYPMRAMVTVTCVRQAAMSGRDEETSVDLQITDMALEMPDED